MKFIPALLTAILVITSCNNDDDNGVDTTKPVIALNEPGDDEEFLPGGEIHFDADFSDNVALGSYKIEIHDASDGHNHRSPQDSHEVAWTYETTAQFTQNAKNENVHIDIDIPLTINGEPIKEGHYHLGVFCTDKAGNQSQVFTEIVIGEHDH